jgi:rfaE bifunctional protein kinase chain/domain
MLFLSESRLKKIMSSSEKKIAVIGDLMIDRYLWGDVSRISPEAPVPIINIEEEEIRFGGAANVANNLIGLGAIPILVGVVGDDIWGEVFRNKLSEKGLPGGGVVVDINRPTTIKTRIIGNNQHIARVDREKVEAVADENQNKILKFLKENIQEIDAIILQDYNKGLLVPGYISKIIQLANSFDKFITVDPKFKNFFEFHDVTVFKPNKKETEEALAMHLTTRNDLIEAGNILLEKLNADAVLITRGKEGMALFKKNEEVTFIDTRARKVADVSGAGDTVIATLTYALAADASITESVTLANYAAGLVCEEVGVVPVQGDKLYEAIMKNQGKNESV